jgi:hypothetical protein
MPLPVPTEDFNFEEQNAKFKKEEVAKVCCFVVYWLTLLASQGWCSPVLQS